MPFTRDELLGRYLDQVPFEPYPVQEEALLAWFAAEQGVLVCTPTGTGKTMIAEAALFEALHNGTIAYYTTPLIALTEQKFHEMQAAAVRWGFQPDDVGLVTGNRRENPDARVLVVVAEILLNRLLHGGAQGGKGDRSNLCDDHASMVPAFGPLRGKSDLSPFNPRWAINSENSTASTGQSPLPRNTGSLRPDWTVDFPASGEGVNWIAKPAAGTTSPSHSKAIRPSSSSLFESFKFWVSRYSRLISS